MDLTKYDISITVSMLIGIIILSFIFGSIGATNVNVQVNDIPELDIKTDRFDFAGEFPGTPKTQASGEVNVSDPFVSNYVNDLSDAAIVMVEVSNETWEVRLMNEDRTIIRDNATVTPGDSYWLADGSQEINGEYTDDGFITWEFISGGDYSGIVGSLRYIAEIFVWGFGTVITIFTNLFGVVFDVIQFTLGLGNWILSTYLGVVNAASGWVSLVVMVPGVLLMYELAKIIAIVVHILWIG